MLKKLIPILLCTFHFTQGLAQKDNVAFNNEELEKQLLININKFRTKNKLDSIDFNEVLNKASSNRAKAMAKAGDAKADINAAIREVKTNGGTKNVEEVAIDLPVVKAGKDVGVEKLAYDAVKIWDSGNKEKPILINGNYVYAGIAAQTNKENTKVFISVIFGSYNTFNTGADKRSELPVPYSKKNKKMLEPEKNICKNCDKFKDYYALQKGVSVKDGKIYLEYSNLRQLKRLLKLSKDAIAVDVVQRKQYENPNYNIVDNNLFTKGIIVNKIYKDNFFKANIAKPTKKGRQPANYEAVIGKLPKGLTGAYEINLIIIQSDRVCRTVTRSYLEEGDVNSSTPFQMLLHPKTDSCLVPPFKPVAESTIITLIVPFEKNKSEYKPEDIAPFVNAMNEPDFIIDGIYIYAYSSIEGDSVANALLQHKRGESIVNALKGMSKDGILTKVVTGDSWDLFVHDMDNPKYQHLTKMKKQDAIKEINSKGLSKDLEPWLSKERYAKIVLDITYDIKGVKEEKYSAINFNRAVKANNIKLALKIQNFIEKNVTNKRYTEGILDKIEIPKEKQNFGVLMNQVVYRSLRTKTVNEDDQAELKDIAKLEKGNPYLKYNILYCNIKLDTLGADKRKMDNMQKRIDSLYATNIPKKYLDAMNIEYQFKIIDELDTVDKAQPLIEACVNKVKSFYDLKDASWQNSLKLAYVFARFRDYKYASSLLEPFVQEKNAAEELLFSYISICAQIPAKTKSRSFADALKKARNKNSKRYCNLFGEPHLTFQMLDNPFVKEEFNKAGCK